MASDAVRVVALRGDAVIWATEVPRADGDAAPEATLEAALAQALAAAPRVVGCPPAVVALGPSCAQLRRLADLPPLPDARALARVVREGAGRFFLKNGVPLLTTGVRLLAPGQAWAAALEEPTVRAVATACRAAGVRVRALVPAPVALARAIGDGSATWRDGPVETTITAARGRLVEARRCRAHPAPTGTVPTEGAVPTVPAALAALGDRGWTYADAYGAALVASDEPVALRPGVVARDGAAGPRWRLALARAACAVALLAALAAPGLRAASDARVATRQLALLAPAARTATEHARALAAATGALAELAAFDGDRPSATRFLGRLTSALPAGAALVALRVDSAGGTLMALAPRAAAILPSLDTLPGLAGLAVVGPVTREVVVTADPAAAATGGVPTGTAGGAAAREMERVTLRFRWAGPHAQGDR